MDLFKFGVCRYTLQTKPNSQQMVANILQTKGYDEVLLVTKPAIWRIRSLLDGLWQQPASWATTAPPPDSTFSNAPKRRLCGKSASAERIEV